MDDWKIVQRVAGLFREENDVPEQECASINDECAAHNSEGLTLKLVRLLYLPANTTSHLQPLD